MTAQKSLSNIQLELLKLYANDLSNEQLYDIKLLLAKYFARKATEAMDKQWEERGLTEQDMVDWTNQHARANRS